MAATVLLDCERMRYPYTGLYQFCLHLGAHLQATAAPAHRMCFYGPSSLREQFGPKAIYRRQLPVHKWVLPPLPDVALWHCTHQDAAYFPFRHRIKKVLTLHDLNYGHDASKAFVKRKRFFDAVQRKIDAADAVVAISQYSLNDACNQLDLEGKARYVIYNGCTVAEGPAPEQPAQAPSRPFLFSVGTLAPKKNFHVLPRLLPGNDFLLVIAGLPQNTAYREAIEAEAVRMGVRHRLLLPGAVTEAQKRWYLQHCEAFVFPSLAEGFGLPVIEAMHYGRPVLLSTATSLPEIGGTPASYFTSFEPEAMQSDLLTCLRRYAEDATLTMALKERAALFSWRQAALAYHRVYAEALARS